MLLRSSSTPLLGSLLASISDSSPNVITSHYEPKPPTIHHTPNKFSFHQPGGLNISHNSSPISPSIDFDRFSSTGFRRAQSDGNLEGLAYASYETEDQLFESSQNKRFSSRSKCMMLQTIPSFSFHNSGGYDDDEEDSDMEYEEEEEEEFEENVAMKGENVGLEEKVKNMSLTQDVKFLDKIWSAGFEGKREFGGQEMHLARGLGIGGGSGGGRGGRKDYWEGSCGDGGDNKPEAEEHYNKLVEENPGNPLFLANYAQFLYQTKRDLHGSEKYYSRAILADAKDGDVLAQYASLVWELHHDQDRALSYYERAVQAAPQDSHVHAAYASFLWETEDDEEDEDEVDAAQDVHAMPSYLRGGIMSSATA